MSTQRINAAEKDLEKFIKFLALKSTQVVVQSRLGEKIQTKCNPLAGNDWFNIVVEDHPDVYAETKKALAITPGESILKRLPLCVEISLKTSEGDQMVLEVWSLELQALKTKEDCKEKGQQQTQTQTTQAEQPCLKTAHAIYNRMGMLLKSLISLTRSTPAYKLSRRQCPDSYSIYYRIYVERPQTHCLGEGHKNVKIGHLNTIVGNLTMSVAYRTKMTITPTTTTINQAKARESNSSNTIMIDSNHFKHCENAPNGKHAGGGIGGGGNGLNMKKGSAANGGDRKIIDIEKPLRPGAFTDMGKIKQYTEDDYVLPETPPFEWLLRKPRHESTGSNGTQCCGGSIESLNRKCDSPQLPATTTTSPLANGHQHNINNNSLNSNNNNNNIANACNNNNNAFKSLENDENLKNSSANSSTHSQSPVKSLFVPVTPAPATATTNTSSSASSTNNMTATNNLHATNALSADDENLLKELNFPFASPTSHVNDLAKFYRDCYHAPPLRGLNEIQNETCSSAANRAQSSTATALSQNACSTANSAPTSNNPAGDFTFVDDLSKQLEQFETSLEDYDKLVLQFGNLTNSSSTGSRSSGGLQMSN